MNIFWSVGRKWMTFENIQRIMTKRNNWVQTRKSTIYMGVILETSVSTELMLRLKAHHNIIGPIKAYQHLTWPWEKSVTCYSLTSWALSIENTCNLIHYLVNNNEEYVSSRVRTTLYEHFVCGQLLSYELKF